MKPIDWIKPHAWEVPQAWEMAWPRWQVTQLGTGKRLELEPIHPLSFREARRQWASRPGQIGAFNGINIAAARPIGQGQLEPCRCNARARPGGATRQLRPSSKVITRQRLQALKALLRKGDSIA